MVLTLKRTDTKGHHLPIDLDLLLQAYANGIFPMSDARDDPETFWIEPELRAIMPLDGFRVSKSLAKTIRQDRLLLPPTPLLRGSLPRAPNRKPIGWTLGLMRISRRLSAACTNKGMPTVLNAG